MIKEISIGEIVKSVSITHKFDKEKLIFLNTSDVSDGNILVNNYFNVKDLKGQAKKTIKKNDILFSEIRPKNKRYAYVNIEDTYDYVVSTKLMVLRKYNPNVLNKYFYYFLTYEGTLDYLQMRAENRIGSFPQITFDILKPIKFNVPSLGVQQKIVDIISTLDNKIENNNKIKTELDAVSKMLYDYWFVQFDFPDENGKPYKSSGGKMVYNNKLKRIIPDGWGVETLSNLSSIIVRGISPKYNSEGISVINQKCIRNKTIDFSLARKHNNSTGANKLVKVGDILVNSTGVGTLGRVAVIKRLETDLTTADSHVTIVRINDEKVNSYYAGYALSEKQSEIEQLGNGSTGQTELSRENLGKLWLIVPNEKIQLHFEEILKPIFHKTAVNEKQNQELASLRDWLLPMLMNGQITVGEAEYKIEERLSKVAEPEQYLNQQKNKKK